MIAVLLILDALPTPAQSRTDGRWNTQLLRKPRNAMFVPGTAKALANLLNAEREWSRWKQQPEAYCCTTFEQRPVDVASGAPTVELATSLPPSPRTFNLLAAVIAADSNGPDPGDCTRES
jgi:hypothetical protein